MESFEIFRSLESGKPLSVAQIAAPFNSFEQEISARVYSMGAANLPLVADTWSITSDISQYKKAQDFEFVKKTSYPSVFSFMTDLSPTSYSDLAQRIYDDEEVALQFINLSAFNNDNNKRDDCDSRCRKKHFCQINYAVNEQSVLCAGYEVSLW